MAVTARTLVLSDRRGFVFTSVAVLIIAALLVLAWSEHGGSDRARTRAEHALTAQTYLANLEQDLPRAAYISSFRCFLALEEHVSTTGTFLLDVDASFAECFSNGTIVGQPGLLMEDSSFQDLLARFTAIANSRGMTVNITQLDAHTAHNEPFVVTTTVLLLVRVTDATNSLAINRTISIQANVPITDIKDPLYTVGTLGRNPRPIAQTNSTRPFITAANDTTSLLAHIEQGGYIADTSAPDFLMRFAGNLSASPHGIASLVNIQDLAAQDGTIKHCYSIVDYKYFGTAQTTPNRYIVNTNPASVWLSDADLAFYDATGAVLGEKPCP
jgi:hypothetical protein